QAPRAELPADAGLLVAAERGRGGDQVVVVDPNRAGPQTRGDRQRARDVPGPDAARQTVDRVVRDPDGILDRLVADHREHRPEDLLLGDPHPVVDLAEDRRLYVAAAGRRALRRAPAREELGALVLAELDVAPDRVELGLVDEGADVRVEAHRVAD